MYLVFDVGGTNTKYAQMDGQGTIIEKGSFKTVKESKEAFYHSLLEITHLYKDLEGIALSYPGLLDSDEGLVINATAIPILNGKNVALELSKLTQLPVSIENDGKCAALAELWQGSIQGCSSALVIVLGSGVGGAIILDGKLYKGKHFKAGEFGSFLCEYNNDTNEAVSLGRFNSSVRFVRNVAEKCGIEEDGERVFELIKAKDPIAYPLFKRYCNQLAKEIFNVDYVLDLERVAIGGGISVQPILIQTLNESFKELREKYRDDIYDLDIVACMYHNDANLLGALYHHLNGGAKVCGE